MYDYLKEHDSTTVNTFKIAGIQCSPNYHDHHSQSCIIRKMHHFLGCKWIMNTLQEIWWVLLCRSTANQFAQRSVYWDSKKMLYNYCGKWSTDPPTCSCNSAYLNWWSLKTFNTADSVSWSRELQTCIRTSSFAEMIVGTTIQRSPWECCQTERVESTCVHVGFFTKM